MEWVPGGVGGHFFGKVLTAAYSAGRITGPSVGCDVGVGANVSLDERTNRVRRGVVCGFDSYANAVIFSRYESQRVACSSSSFFPVTNRIFLIDHNETVQSVGTSRGHRAAKLMQPVPHSSVRAETHQLLQLACVNSSRARCHFPHRREPASP